MKWPFKKDAINHCSDLVADMIADRVAHDRNLESSGLWFFRMEIFMEYSRLLEIYDKMTTVSSGDAFLSKFCPPYNPSNSAIEYTEKGIIVSHSNEILDSFVGRRTCFGVTDEYEKNIKIQMSKFGGVMDSDGCIG